MDVKTCRRCGVEKPVAMFHRNKASPDGYQPRCKHCVKQAQAERAATSSRPADDRRGHAQWEPWELDYLTKNPALTAGQVARRLKRTAQAVRVARYRMAKLNRPHDE